MHDVCELPVAVVAGLHGHARDYVAGLLREGWTQTRATAALHALTSVETFVLLRPNHGLSLAQVKATITQMAHASFVAPR